MLFATRNLKNKVTVFVAKKTNNIILATIRRSHFERARQTRSRSIQVGIHHIIYALAAYQLGRIWFEIALTRHVTYGTFVIVIAHFCFQREPLLFV